MMVAVVCVCSIISIPLPITPVPLSLATLSVMLAGALLGPIDGIVTIAVYILLGTIGLPVFSKMQSGPAVLAGPTGGFFVGYIAMAFLCGFIPYLFQRFSSGRASVSYEGSDAAKRGKDALGTLSKSGNGKMKRGVQQTAVYAIAMTASTAALYLCGCLWYMVYANVSFGASLAACALPFLPGDAIKVIIAAPLSARFSKIVRNMGHSVN